MTRLCCRPSAGESSSLSGVAPTLPALECGGDCSVAKGKAVPGAARCSPEPCSAAGHASGGVISTAPGAAKEGGSLADAAPAPLLAAVLDASPASCCKRTGVPTVCKAVQALSAPATAAGVHRRLHIGARSSLCAHKRVKDLPSGAPVPHTRRLRAARSTHAKALVLSVMFRTGRSTLLLWQSHAAGEAGAASQTGQWTDTGGSDVADKKESETQHRRRRSGGGPEAGRPHPPSCFVLSSATQCVLAAHTRAACRGTRAR